MKGKQRAGKSNRAKKRKFGAKSLRVRVVLLVLACYLLPSFVLGAYTQAVLLPVMERDTRTAIASSSENAWALATRNVERVIELARDATYDGELLEIHASWAEEQIGDSEFLRRTRSYLDRKYSREQLLQYVTFFPISSPELLATAGSGRTDSAVTMQALRQEIITLGETLDTRCLFVDLRGELYLIRNMMNLRMDPFGMLVLKLDQDRLFTSLRELQDTHGGQVLLGLDDFGEPADRWEGIPAGMTDDRSSQVLTFASRSTNQDYDLRLMLALNRREIYREYFLFRQLTAAVFLLLIPTLLMIVRYTRKRMIRPIEMLSDAAGRIEGGELGVTVPLQGEDEMGRLGIAFTRMSLRLEELINQTYKEEIELKNAQIQALQSRINPHFINNALEDINWMARIEGAESVSSMVTSLSTLLNAAMARDNRRMTNLSEELNVADAYIFFAEQRFGAGLEIRREVEEEALDCSLPLMTVQPLLENAVEHGIAPAGGGRITLRARREELPPLIGTGAEPDRGAVRSRLRLEIANTGKPMDQQDWDKINTALRGENAGPHLGLANIVNRLRLIYGPEVVIQVEAEEETVVRVIVPQPEQREA